VTNTATDIHGNSSVCYFTVTVVDDQAPVVTVGSIAACYTTTNAAQADAIAATTATDNCGSVTKTAGTVGTCSAVVTVTVTDSHGNSATATYNTRIDNQAPVIASVTATESASNVKNCANATLQGVVNFAVQASDNCSIVNGHPSIGLVNGVNSDTATFVNEFPAGTFNYTWTVGPSTANGTWTATVTASDLCQNTTSNITLCVNQTQISGQLQLEGFVGTATVPAHSRMVHFVATDGSANVLKTWDILVSNASGDTFNYTLTGVPAGTVGLSAKTAWNLRSKVTVTYSVGQGTANFLGAYPGAQLRGGDFDGDNILTFNDYQALGTFLFSSGHPSVDINGDGVINNVDYSIFSGNWLDPKNTGDPQ
jgi:hypothetical protein